jgi:predicted metal-binding membrane protein
MSDTALETALRRDRAIVATALAILVVLAWTYTVWLAGDMEMGGMDMTGFRMIPAGAGLMMPADAPWPLVEFAFVFAMWAVMMVGMMTPSAVPMVLLYARVGRQAARARQPFAASAWFAGGYLLAWTVFAAVATVAQWATDRLAFMTPTMASAKPWFSGVVLIAAGLYQWTPLKDACLRQCQAPLQFIQRHGGFRGGAAGALRLGARHGFYCVGCCWMLMALLFVGGIMNVLWIAALTIFVLVEKLAPAGRIISRVTGAALFAAGVWVLLRSF